MTYECVQLCFLMLCVLATTTAQEPPRSCVSTGPTCIESCVGLEDDLYQWCGACHWFIQCTSNDINFQECSGELLYSDTTKSCQPVSDTCEECTIDTTPNDATTTKPMTTETPPVDALCQSTGPDCISDCFSTPNGIYQWCGRCDYFLQCSGGSEYYTKCPSNLYYDDSKKSCETSSTTCFQSPCYEDLTTTAATNFTTTIPTTRYDHCSSSPCMNDGTCIDAGNTYSCQCPPSFSGLQCETESPCYSSPCLNGGSCSLIGEGDSYSCNCPPSITGSMCQTELYDVNATCGDLMRSTPFDPSPGWTKLCEITRNDDASRLNTTCKDLLHGLPLFVDSAGLLQAGGNYGCWLTKHYPVDIQEACLNGYQHTLVLESCVSCTHLIACVRYPY